MNITNGDTKTFTIAQVERLSRIKSHTIRVWERRYGFLHPDRNLGNIRHYSLDEVERIMYVSMLNGAGVKISQLSGLDILQLRELAAKETGVLCSTKTVIIHLIVSFYDEAIENFETVLDKAAKSLDHFTFVNHVIIPFLSATNLLAYIGNEPHIHFAVTSIRRKLLVAIDQTNPAFSSNEKIVLFLPEGEHFDLILLYAYFNLKYRGFSVYYLGTNVSTKTFKSVIVTKRPHQALMYAAPTKKVQCESLNTLLETELPEITLTIMVAATHCCRQLDRVKLTHYLNLSLPTESFV